MGINFGIKMRDAQALFFDRQAVTSLLTRNEIKLLSRVGSFTRRTARASIKISRKNESSAPGDVPKGHTDDLRKKIAFSADTSARSVVIGPTAFEGRTGKELAALEEGGETDITETVGGTKKRRRVVIKARPFMLPAFRSAIPQAVSMMAHVS